VASAATCSWRTTGRIASARCAHTGSSRAVIRTSGLGGLAGVVRTGRRQPPGVRPSDDRCHRQISRALRRAGRACAGRLSTRSRSAR
jgi:hypothetical protein